MNIAPIAGAPGVTPVPAQPIDKQLDTIKEETPKAHPNDDSAAKLDALARREKAIRQRHLESKKQLDQERLQLEAERQEIAQAKQWRSRLADDPVSVLNEAGVSYDSLTNQFLNQPTPEVLELRRKVQALEAKSESTETQIKKAQQEQYEQAVKQIETEVGFFIDGNDSFEMLKAHGKAAQKTVAGWIESTFKKKGYVMPIEQAAEQVEKHLLKKAVELAKIKKVQAQLTPAQEAQAAPQEKIQTEQKRQTPMNTLSNRITPSTKGYTEKERVQRAILRAQGIDPDSVQA